MPNQRIMRAPVERVFRQNDPVRRLSLSTRLCEQPIDEEDEITSPSAVLHSSSVALGVPPPGGATFVDAKTSPTILISLLVAIHSAAEATWRDGIGKGHQEHIEPGLIVAVVRFGFVPIRVRVASRR